MSFSLDEDNDQTQSQVDGNQGGEDPNKNKDQSQTDSSVSLGGAGSGILSAGGSNPSAPAQSGKPSSSGSWTNLQSYLDANKEQGSQVGSQIGSTITGQAETAKNDVNSAASDFSNQVKANTINADPNQVSNAISSALGSKSGSSLNPDDVSGFQKQASAAYNGPTDFTKGDAYAKAQSDLTNAQRSIDQTRSEGGRDVLLQNQYKDTSQNGYTQGEQSLDQMLLENNPDNTATFKGIQDQYSGLNSILSTTTAAQNTAAQQAAATDVATANAAKQALQDATDKFKSGINTNVAAAQKNYTDSLNAIQSDIQSGHLTATQLESMGISPGTRLYNLNLKDYLTPGVAPTLANSATADQYAQAAALAQLAGQPVSEFLPMSNSSQAGTATNVPYTFDTKRFNSDQASVNSGEQTYTQAQWNTPQVIPSLGDTPVSMKDLQDFVDSTAATQAQLGRKNPYDWQGQYADIARQYMQVISDWKAAHAYTGQTINPIKLIGNDYSYLK